MMKNYNDSNKNNDIMIPLVKCVIGGNRNVRKSERKFPFFRIIDAPSPDQQGALSALYSLNWDIYLETYKSNYNLVISLF